jgi:ribonuclease R
MCKHASINEKRASDAERASIKYKQVEYMSKHIGKEFSGMITGITNWGIYVEVLDGLCEGMVPINSLRDDNYYFDEKDFVIKGSRHGHEYNIGDKVTIKVLRTDIYRRQIDFQMLE